MTSEQALYKLTTMASRYGHSVQITKVSSDYNGGYNVVIGTYAYHVLYLSAFHLMDAAIELSGLVASQAPQKKDSA